MSDQQSNPKKIQYHWEIDAYKLSVSAAMSIYDLSKSFPKEETYSLTDQIRRSSRSVSGSIAEGWRRRKYRGAFVNKINEAEAEAAETQAWSIVRNVSTLKRKSTKAYITSIRKLSAS